MAGKSAFSCLFSFLRPLAAHPSSTAESSNPASQRTPICPDGRLDSSSAGVERVFAASPSVPYFTVAVDEQTSLRESDPASFLIERLDQGWFEENVMRCQWWDNCTLSWSRSGPRTSEVMGWTPNESEDSNLAASRGLTLRKSIEMVQPLASTSSSAVDRDPRGLPGSRLRRLPKVHPDLDMPGAAGKHKRRPRHRAQSEDMSERLGRVGHKRLEICNSTKLERSTKKQISGPSEKQRRRAELEESVPVPAAPARWRRDRRKSSKSATDDEYDELRGCMDLGFNFNRNDLSPRVVSLLPGLKAYKSGDFDFLDSLNKSSARTRTHSPKGWTTNADSPLLKWHIPSSQDGSVDMKAHLKFWAHSVASSVSAEC